MKISSQFLPESTTKNKEAKRENIYVRSEALIKHLAFFLGIISPKRNKFT